MAGVPSNKLFKLPGWPRGVDNIAREDAVDLRSLREALNVDIDAQGKVYRRQGAELVAPVAGLHSLFAEPRFPLMLAAAPGQLLSFDSTLTQTAIAPLTVDEPVSYASVTTSVYFSNGVDRGQVSSTGVVRDWAPTSPSGQPDAIAFGGAGGLDAGLYQVAITFVDDYGRESGAAHAVVVDVAEGQGILLTNFPAAGPDTAVVRIYCSPANGDALLLVQEFPVGLAQFLIGRHTPGRRLETQFLEPLPAGDIVRAHGARLHVARGNMHLWSEALNYGLYRPSSNYTRYESKLLMIEPAGQAENSGMFVGTASRTYFVSGPAPANWRRIIASPTGVVPGSATQVDAAEFGIDGVTGMLPLWLSTDGQLTLGLSTGQTVQLHDKHYAAFADAERASIAMRTYRGMTHVVATLRGGTVAGLRATDNAEAEVWKNGVRVG